MSGHGWGIAVRVMVTDIVTIAGIDSGVLPVYVVTSIFKKVALQVEGSNLHWGRHFLSLQAATSTCLGEVAIIDRASPLEVLDVVQDHNSFGSANTGTRGYVYATSVQLGETTKRNYERVVCAAAIAAMDPTGVQHYDFMRTVANLRVAVVQISAINGVANGTIPVLWRSHTTLKVEGFGFGYGDVYISIQPYHSRCDGATSLTGDSYAVPLTSLNASGYSGSAVLGTATESHIGNTTRQRGQPYQRVCVAMVGKHTHVTMKDFVTDSGFAIAVVNITSINDVPMGGVVAVYKGGTHKVEVRGTSLDQGQIWFTMQPYSSMCNGTMAAMVRSQPTVAESGYRKYQAPMRLWPSYADPSQLA